SRASCGPAVPGSCAGRLHPRAGGLRTRGAAGGGAAAGAAACWCPVVGLARTRRTRSRRLGLALGAPRAGSGRANAPPPHRAVLAALALDAHELLLEVDVAEIEIDGFAAAQACGVHELAECAVSQAERTIALEAREL